MPTARVNGITLHFGDNGTGEPIIMIMGTGGSGRIWHLHQVPALTAAGYRVITPDNRGIPPTDECASGFTVNDMAVDVAALIEHLQLDQARVVGTSLGAYVTAELTVARPDLVRQAVLLAARARSDVLRIALAQGERALRESGIELPLAYRAVVEAMQVLSRTTLDDEQQARDWLDLIELSRPSGKGVEAQQNLEPMPDRRAAYRRIRVPCRVVSFADDLVTPAYLGKELAEVIPGAQFEEIPRCGHYGYLENPEAVNRSIIEFFRGA